MSINQDEKNVDISASVNDLTDEPSDSNITDIEAAAVSKNYLLELQEAEKNLSILQDQYLRACADVENTRRRAQEDVQKAHKYGVEKLASELVVVRDSLELALGADQQTIETLRTGVEMTLKQLIVAFEHSAIAEINPIHTKFDPAYHQAMSIVSTDEHPAQTVVQVLQKGYRLSDRVLRPALVAVSQAVSKDDSK